MDEHFGVNCMMGSEAITQLRARGSREVIIACSGNDADVAAKLGDLADAVWPKPYPNWQDGTMLREVVTLLRRRHFSASQSHPSESYRVAPVSDTVSMESHSSDA